MCYVKIEKRYLYKHSQVCLVHEKPANLEQTPIAFFADEFLHGTFEIMCQMPEVTLGHANAHSPGRGDIADAPLLGLTT